MHVFSKEPSWNKPNIILKQKNTQNLVFKIFIFFLFFSSFGVVQHKKEDNG